VRVFLPRGQKARIITAEAFERTDAVRGSRIYAEELRRRAGDLIMLFRGSMAADLDRASCSKHADSSACRRLDGFRALLVRTHLG